MSVQPRDNFFKFLSRDFLSRRPAIIRQFFNSSIPRLSRAWFFILHKGNNFAPSKLEWIYLPAYLFTIDISRDCALVSLNCYLAYCPLAPRAVCKRPSRWVKLQSWGLAPGAWGRSPWPTKSWWKGSPSRPGTSTGSGQKPKVSSLYVITYWCIFS